MTWYATGAVVPAVIAAAGAVLLPRHRPSGRHRRLTAIAADVAAGDLDPNRVGYCPDCCRGVVIRPTPAGPVCSYCDHPTVNGEI